MKKILKLFLIVIIALIALYFMVGYTLSIIYDYNRTKNLALDTDTITITEQEFINYMEELYMYPEKYLGRKIAIEGYYDLLEYDDDEYINFVYRVLETEDKHSHDDECKEEHTLGFEFFCNDELPEVGSFIQVTGTLGTITEGEEVFLVLEECTVHTDAER